METNPFLYLSTHVKHGSIYSSVFDEKQPYSKFVVGHSMLQIQNSNFHVIGPQLALRHNSLNCVLHPFRRILMLLKQLFN